MTQAAAVRSFVLLQVAVTLADGKWIDMSHVYDKETIGWGNGTRFQHRLVFESKPGDKFYLIYYDIELAEHSGTHIDAPVHFAKGKATVDKIPVENLIGQAIVVNISEQVSKDRNYQLTVSDLQMWEKQNGQIPDGSILLVLTGLGKFWPDPLKFMGTNSSDPKDYRFPGIHPDAAQWLVDNRKLKGVGLDSRSLDYGKSTSQRSHQIILGKSLFGLECVANIDKLPVKGATIYVMPMKIKNGSGGPTRIIANTNGDQVGGSCGVTGSVPLVFLAALVLKWFI